MAITHPDVEWIFDVTTYTAEYGLLGLGGKWAVVRKVSPFDNKNFVVVTDYVDERKTAVGFLKLLMGK